jgi:hypothetical protein
LLGIIHDAPIEIEATCELVALLHGACTMPSALVCTLLRCWMELVALLHEACTVQLAWCKLHAAVQQVQEDASLILGALCILWC